MFAAVRWVNPVTKNAMLTIGFFTDYDGYYILRNNLPIDSHGNITDGFMEDSEGTMIPAGCVTCIDFLRETPALHVIQGGAQ